MTVSKAAQKATEKYKKANYDRINVLLPKGTKEKIQQTGDTVNGFINKAVAERLEILSVSLDNDKDAWLKAIKDDNLTWNHVSDLKGWGCEAAQLYGVNGIPHLVVLDENNVIVAKNLRGEALKAKVAELLK